MIQIPYGRAGNNNEMPDGYDTSTLFTIKRYDYLIAEGYWESTYRFLLKRGAIILNLGKTQGGGVRKIIERLIEEGNVIHDGERDYDLLADIYLLSPSSASRLILGQQSNGYKDWRTEKGIMLGHIAWPENKDYH